MLTGWGQILGVHMSMAGSCCSTQGASREALSGGSGKPCHFSGAATKVVTKCDWGDRLFVVWGKGCQQGEAKRKCSVGFFNKTVRNRKDCKNQRSEGDHRETTSSGPNRTTALELTADVTGDQASKRPSMEWEGACSPQPWLGLYRCVLESGQGEPVLFKGINLLLVG